MNLALIITDFADQAVMLPLAVLIGVAMVAAGWRRGALAWACVITGMLAVMLILKLWVGRCGPLLVGEDLQSPSGHTAAAASIYGGALTLLLRRTVRRVPVGFVCAGVFALLVGVTRVILGAHSVIEVAIGACVGVLAAVILEQAAGPVPRHIQVLPVGIAVVAVVVLFHGFHLPAEAAIRRARFDWLPLSLCRLTDTGLDRPILAMDLH
jgi:hypothetical protein